MLFIVILSLLLVIYYYFSSMTDKEDLFGLLIKETLRYLDSPNSIIYTILVILIFYTILFVCRIPMTKDTKPYSMEFIEIQLWFSLFCVIFVDLFKYLFGINVIEIILEKIYDYWSLLPDDGDGEPEPEVVNLEPVLNPKQDREVFNISNNLYTYDDAQAICKSYDSRLATYEEIEDSYNNGSEWCNYGWSDGQMILFPTQKATWDKLQQTKGQKNDCGRPGINGGYIANPTMQFGVNCFGKKPEAKITDLVQMTNNNTVPKTKEDEILDAKVKYWQENSDKMLTVNSFNKEKWNEF